MKKYTSFRKMLSGVAGGMFAMVLIVAVFVALGYVSTEETVPQNAKVSHELVFYEFSPEGAAGGYMMPASCPSGFVESGPHTWSPLVLIFDAISWTSFWSTTYSAPCVAVTPDLSIYASPTSVMLGGVATLTWSSTNVTSCTASGSWSGAKAVSGSESTGALTTSPNIYTLTCTGPYGSVSRTARTTIPAPTLTIRVSPTVIAYGGSSTITWSATNVTSCTASGDWSGEKSVSGTQSTGALTKTPNTYTMTCTGPGGSVTKNANAATGGSDSTSVTIPAPTAAFQIRVNGGAWTEADKTIDPVDRVDARWSSANAATCLGQEFSTSGTTSGTLSNISIPDAGASKDYKIQCTGATGTSPAAKTIKVTVRSSKPTLTASSLSVESGSRVTLTYDLNNNTSCTFSTTDGTLNNVMVTTSGAKQTGLITQQTAYTLACPGGSTSIMVNIEGTIQEQ